jgi:hypothetical protein
LQIINAVINASCFGGVPTDQLSISLFQDATPCDNNPEALVDCQVFDACDVQPINWSATYNNLVPNTLYIIQLEGGIGNLNGDVNGEIMISTTINPAVAVQSTDPTCGIDCDGSLMATPLAGAGLPPYSFLWSNGETNASISNLCAGSLTVTMTDANGCTATATGNVTEVTLPAFSVILPATTCNGASVQLGAVGGQTYQWIGPAGYSATGPYPDIDNISASLNGTYSVTITDNSGCSESFDVLVSSVSCPEICANGIDDDVDGLTDADDPDCPCRP